MAGIFVSYRRSDSAGFTGRLTDDLESQFPEHRLFRDVESIEAGADFVEAIDQALRSSSVLLVVIGPRWLDTTGADGQRRLDDPADFVRLEIAAALKLGLRVIPVLVDGAAAPAADALPPDLAALARRQAHELSDRRWDYDVEQLFRQIDKFPGLARRAAAAAAGEPSGGRPWGWPKKLALGTGALALGAVLLGAMSDDPVRDPPGLPGGALRSAPGAPAAVTMPASTTAAAPVLPNLEAPTGKGVTAATRVGHRVATAPPAAPLDLTGLWRTQEGDSVYFEQRRDEIAAIAGDATATQGFVGTGTVQGRSVTLALTHLQSGVPVAMSLDVSPDGRRMSGVGRVQGMAGGERIVLVRQ